MKNVSSCSGAIDRWGPGWFTAAGGLLFVQVLLIGMRKYAIASVPELWIAPPAIAALVAALVAVIALRRRLARAAPRLAAVAMGLAVLAAAILGTASIWIVARVILGGTPLPLPTWFFAIIGGFMLTFMLSFLVAALAGLRASGSTRLVGYLLLAPVVSWSVILAAGFLTSFSEALKLDFYTNGIIAFAFLALARALRREAT